MSISYASWPKFERCATPRQATLAFPVSGFLGGIIHGKHSHAVFLPGPLPSSGYNLAWNVIEYMPFSDMDNLSKMAIRFMKDSHCYKNNSHKKPIFSLIKNSRVQIGGSQSHSAMNYHRSFDPHRSRSLAFFQMRWTFILHLERHFTVQPKPDFYD